MWGRGVGSKGSLYAQQTPSLGTFKKREFLVIHLKIDHLSQL